MSECVCVRERESVCVCVVCVCEREVVPTIVAELMAEVRAPGPRTMTHNEEEHDQSQMEIGIRKKFFLRGEAGGGEDGLLMGC